MYIVFTILLILAHFDLESSEPAAIKVPEFLVTNICSASSFVPGTMNVAAIICEIT